VDLLQLRLPPAADHNHVFWRREEIDGGGGLLFRSVGEDRIAREKNNAWWENIRQTYSRWYQRHLFGGVDMFAKSRAALQYNLVAVGLSSHSVMHEKQRKIWGERTRRARATSHISCMSGARELLFFSLFFLLNTGIPDLKWMSILRCLMG
jgi:hypothetical protein